jgi:hypothetical protein
MTYHNAQSRYRQSPRLIDCTRDPAPLGPVAALADAAEINARAIAQGRTEPCPDADEAVGLTVKGGAA